MSSRPAWARPGVEVVCIDDDIAVPDEVVRLPMLNEVLTIADVHEQPNCRSVVVGGRLLVFQPGLFISFREFSATFLGIEVGWPVDHFRPLLRVTLEDDIKLFRRIAEAADAQVLDVV